MTDLGDELLDELAGIAGALAPARWEGLARRVGAALVPTLLAAWERERAADRPSPLLVWLPGLLLPFPEPAVIAAGLLAVGMPRREKGAAAAACALARQGPLATAALVAALADEPDAEPKTYMYSALVRQADPAGEPAPELGAFAQDRLRREIDIAAAAAPGLAEGLGPLWLLVRLGDPEAGKAVLRARASRLEMSPRDLAALNVVLDRQARAQPFPLTWLEEANAIMTDRWEPWPAVVRLPAAGGGRMPAQPAVAVAGAATAGPANAGASTVGLGRNQPCPCGSGRKVKQCCGRG